MYIRNTREEMKIKGKIVDRISESIEYKKRSN